MARPHVAVKTDEGGDKKSAPPAFTGVSNENMYPDMDTMFGADSDGESSDSSDDQHAQDDQNDSDDDDQSEYFDDGFDGDESHDDGDLSFDDRTPDQRAHEALRRSRQTQEAVLELGDQIKDLSKMMQTGGGNNAASGTDLSDMGFSEEDTIAINEAMKTNPAAALEIMQKQMVLRAQEFAQNTVTNQIKMDRNRTEAERNTVRMFPQMKNPSHPFRRATMARVREMKKSYSARGINPDSMPELIQYAAQEIAASNPELVGASNAKSRLRESSRRRNADRASAQGRTRSQGTRKDDLPELSDVDLQRGRRMGIKVDDPDVRKKLQARRRYYEGRRR